MDPISELAIDCAVMQVISFSADIFSGTKDFFESGRSCRDLRTRLDDFERAYIALKDHLQKLPQPPSSAPRSLSDQPSGHPSENETKPPQPSSPAPGSLSNEPSRSWPENEKELLRIATNIETKGVKLRAKIDKLTTSPVAENNLFRALAHSSKEFLLARNIRALEEKFKKHREKLESRLLLEIFHSTRIQQLLPQTLDENQQYFTKALATVHTAIESLILRDGKATRDLMAAQDSRREEAAAHETSTPFSSTRSSVGNPTP